MSHPLLKFLSLVFTPDEVIWLKPNPYIFWQCRLLDDDLEVWETYLEDKENSESRKVLVELGSHSLDWVLKQVESIGEGLFYAPGKPQQFPLKGYSSLGSNDIGVELDWGSFDEQITLYEQLERVTGLSFNLIPSGGKSVHGHLLLEQNIPIEQRNYLCKLLALLLLGDPAIPQDQQVMRAPGVIRKCKGKQQKWLKEGRKHSLKEVLERLERIFNALVLNFPTTLSDERWRLLAKVLRDDSLLPSIKREQLRLILLKEEAELFPKPVSKPRFEINYSGLSSTVEPPLGYFLSREKQENLQGVSSYRNNIGTALLRDLLGVESWLTSNGVIYSGDAYSLFIDYCQSCPSGGGWDSREWESIWRSNSGKTFSPAITSEGIEKRLHWYRWENDPEYQAKSKKEYAKQFKTTTNNYSDTYTDSYTDSYGDGDIDLDSYCDDCDIPIDDIPEISTEEYQNILNRENEILRVESELKKLSKPQQKKFTPTESYQERYLRAIDFMPNKIYGIKSPMSTGKTFLLKNYIADNYERLIDSKSVILYIGSRKSLQRQFISEVNQAIYNTYQKAKQKARQKEAEENLQTSLFNDEAFTIEKTELLPVLQQFVHLNDNDNIDLKITPWVALCTDSAHKIVLEDIGDNCIIILDEIVGTFAHTYHANTAIREDRYEKIDHLFSGILSKAKSILCFDANLTDREIDHLEVLTSKPSIKIENTYKPQLKNPFKILLGTELAEVNVNDRRPMIKDIIRSAIDIVKIKGKLRVLRNPEKRAELEKKLSTLRMVIPCDSQSFGEKLHKLLKSIGINVTRLDGKTSGNKKSLELLANPNQWIENNQPDCFIYSTSAESGINIDINGYFGQRFCFFSGVCDVNVVNTCTQMLIRIRDDIPTYIFISEKSCRVSGRNKPNSLIEFKKGLDNNFLLKLKTILQGEEQGEELSEKIVKEYNASKNAHYNYAINIQNEGIEEQHNLRELFIEILIAKGYPVEVYSVLNEDFEDVTKLMKKAKDERNAEDASDVFNAPDPVHVDGKYQTDLEETNEGYWAGKVKAAIYNLLPEVWLNDAWSADFINLIRNECPSLAREIELEIKTRNPKNDINANKAIYKKLAKGEFKNIWNLKDDTGLTATLREIGLLELIDSESSFKIDDELPQSILKASKKHKEFLGEWPKRFDKKTNRFVPISDSSRLKQLLGLIGYSTSAQREGAGKRDYIYSIVRPLPTYLKEVKDAQHLAQNRKWYDGCVKLIQEKLTLRLARKADRAQDMAWKVETVLSSNEGFTPNNGHEEILTSETHLNPCLEQNAARPKVGKNYIFFEEMDGFKNELVPEKEEKTGLREDAIGELLTQVGFSQVKAKIANLTDQFRRSNLYMRLAEALTGFKSWSYVGKSHYIVDILTENHLLINSFAPGAPLTLRVDEILRE